MADEKSRSRISVFPLKKINTIMESSSKSSKSGRAPEESLILMAKVTELFIEALTKECYKEENGNKLDYEHVMEVVHSTSRYKFLVDIVPKKITVLEFKQIMAKKEAEERRRNETRGNSSDNETSGTSGSSGSDCESSDTSRQEAVPASP